MVQVLVFLCRVGHDGRGLLGTDTPINRSYGWFSKMRVTRMDISFDAQSNEFGSRLEHELDAGVHLLFVDKLAALCCCNSSFDGGEEPGLVVQIAK